MRTLVSALAALLIVAQASAGELSLWYEQPASLSKWTEALPLGNGRLGAMVFGGTDTERIRPLLVCPACHGDLNEPPVAEIRPCPPVL